MFLSTGRFFNGNDASDPYWSNVVLLSGFEGADGSTSFDDESNSNHALTANGNAQIDTAQFKYGSSSLLLDGSGDFVGALDHADLEFGSGSFTIEGWFRFNSNSVDQSLLSKYQQESGIDRRTWILQYLPVGIPSTPLRFVWSTNGITISSIVANWTPTTGVWYHIAVARSGSTVYMFVDGVEKVNGAISGALHDNSSGLRIGAVLSGGVVTQYFNGWMDEIRLTKAVGRYTSGFTPPTAAFPRF